MDEIIVRLNEDEERVFNQYAKSMGISLSDLFIQALEEKIEDEIDMKIIEEYEENLKKGKIETCSFNEMKNKLDL